MPYALKGRRVLVTAGSRGLGAVIAEKFAAEGCTVAINYVAAADRAEATAKSIEEKHGSKVIVLQGDMGVAKDCERVVKEASEKLGGLDVLISNAGWTKFAPMDDLDTLTEEDWDKCWATNVKGNLFLFRAAIPMFNSNPEGGVFLITSSVAGVALSGSSMGYCVSKAAGLHLMKCLASWQGPKVRINSILPGLLLTEWGAKFSEEKRNSTKQKAVLKKETILEDCAEAFVAAAKNSSLTGQKIQVDSGLFVGMT